MPATRPADHAGARTPLAAPAPASGAELPLREHIARTVRLAAPVMLARAGLLVMASVDTIMAGRVAAEELAYYAIAVAPQVFLLLTGVGALMGTVILTAQADGAGRPQECGRIWRLALLNAAAIGAAWGLLLGSGDLLLRLLGQAPEITRGGAGVLVMLAFGMPPMLMFTATSYFLEGVGRPRPGMVVMLLANVLNFGLNWLFMFGVWDMGAEGAALGTSLTRWFMFFALAGYVLAMRDRESYGVAAPMAGSWRVERRLLRLGAPLSVSYGLETGTFLAMATFAGWLGAVPLAAYQVCLSLLSLIYMLAIGIATATAVRVGNAVGRRDRAGLAVAGWVGVGLGVVVMLALMPLLYGFRAPLVALYNDSPAVAAIAVPGLVIGSLILVVDAAQGILMGALRGAGDVVAPMGLQLVSFWGVIVPLGYFLGHDLGHGVPGLLWAILVGFVLASVLLAWRFRALAAREVPPA